VFVQTISPKIRWGKWMEQPMGHVKWISQEIRAFRGNFRTPWAPWPI